MYFPTGTLTGRCDSCSSRYACCFFCTYTSARNVDVLRHITSKHSSGVCKFCERIVEGDPSRHWMEHLDVLVKEKLLSTSLVEIPVNIISACNMDDGDGVSLLTPEQQLGIDIIDQQLQQEISAAQQLTLIQPEDHNGEELDTARYRHSQSYALHVERKEDIPRMFNGLGPYESESHLKVIRNNIKCSRTHCYTKRSFICGVLPVKHIRAKYLNYFPR